MDKETTAPAGLGSSEGLGPSTAREAFEAWFSEDGKWPAAVRRSGDGYTLAAAQGAWKAWCAARADAAVEIERLEDALADKRETLRRASGWLHAAYDRPPQTPECRSMLAEVDAACDLGA